VFTQFNGEPQSFLTEAQVMEESAPGFVRDRRGVKRNTTSTPLVGPPSIYEGTFVRR